ncbi:mitogen-activated protein kinase HOG1 [Colletotrichum musicola]|uniref:Mitogen-activated protein kinase HOG1 n=1 Tax=Colletotrichum musicola TaxID=2175873 RepID=A0A8H6IQJ7_9PEZI|nr:mitogen-activated protein kinase HOG1 [Colletotrichum musicola]
MSKQSDIDTWIKAGTQGMALWELGRDDFDGLLDLYWRFLATGIQELDDKRFRAIKIAVDKAFKLFDASKRASAVFKLQNLLEQSEGPDHTKFEFAVLILSAKYPNDVPFCSPELRNCVKDLSINALVHKDEWGTHSYAKEYALFKSRCDLVMQKIRILGHEPSAQDVEKVAYVLDGWRVLKAWSATGAANTKIRMGRTPQGQHSLPKTIAVKSISEDNDVVFNYLSEIGIHATANKDELREHFVAYYGWSFWGGHFRIAMQLMCTDLEALLTRKKTPISWEKAVEGWKTPSKKRIQSPLPDKIDVVAGKNILIDDDYNIKIADFGVSKQARNRVQTTMATKAGTTGYTAPEVLRVDEEFHGSYTDKADLWSLGCVIYRMIRGRQFLAHDDETKREAENKVRALVENRWEGFGSKEAHLIENLLCVEVEKRSTARSALESYTRDVYAAGKKPKSV